MNKYTHIVEGKIEERTDREVGEARADRYPKREACSGMKSRYRTTFANGNYAIPLARGLLC